MDISADRSFAAAKREKLNSRRRPPLLRSRKFYNRRGWIITILGLSFFFAQPVSALTFEQARHLLARTGFGAPPLTAIESLMPLDHQTAVERILGGLRTTSVTPPPDWSQAGKPGSSSVSRAGSDKDSRSNETTLMRRGRELKQWWLREMLATDSPLTERLVLFWHKHFPSSIFHVRKPAYLFRQNVLYRANAAGNFAEFIHAMAKDPAMLLYLDGQTNRAGNPNENFAREFLELFTLGEGRVYTEPDIREAARAFTGWRINAANGEFLFSPAEHDGGVKKFFGHSGHFTGRRIIDIVLQQPRTAEHIVEKLWRDFISEFPAPDRVKTLAAEFRNSGYEIKPLLRRILNSAEFQSAENRGTIIKSPVELSIGTLRLFQLIPDDLSWIAWFIAQMGQDLFDPPNVGSWPGGKHWINTATLTARRTFLSEYAGALKNMISNPNMPGSAIASSQASAGKFNARLAIDRPGLMAQVLLPIGSMRRPLPGAPPGDVLRRLLMHPGYQLK